MSKPLTGFEVSGRWTTLSEENALISQMFNETDMDWQVAGHTVLGKPINRIEIGQGPRTILYVGLQHGPEPSGREAALELIRDLAYSNSSDTENYLSKNKVVVIPSTNADGAFGGRNNRNGVNINRDWIRLTQPETRAVQRVIQEVQPEVLVDLHENGLNLPLWAGSPEPIQGTYSGLVGLGEELYDSVIGGVEGVGFTAGRYPRTSTPVSGAATVSGASHHLGLISEPLLRDFSQTPSVSMPYITRVQVSRAAVQAAKEWHRSNADRVAAARISSIDYAVHTTDPVPLVTTEMVHGSPLHLDILGYTLEEPIPEYLIDAHGLVVQGNFVPVNQPARLIVPMLCDPASRDVIVSATRVRRPPPKPKGNWTDTHVMVNGAKRPIVEIRTRTESGIYNVRLPNRERG